MRQDFALYTDSDGLLTSQPNPTPASSGNGLLYTSYEYITYLQWGVLTDDDKAKFVQTVQGCRSNGINGLYNRAPEKIGDQEGPDDYYGLASAGSVNALNVQIGPDIYNYGQTTYYGLFSYMYNNVTPGKFTFQAWFGRQSELVAHIQMAAGKTPEYWRQLYWCASIAVASVSNPSDANHVVLDWAQCNNILPGLDMLKSSALAWKQRMLKNYPNGMQQVFALYFNDANHPLAKWAKTDFVWESAAAPAAPLA